jgi:hypothetical protein
MIKHEVGLLDQLPEDLRAKVLFQISMLLDNLKSLVIDVEEAVENIEERANDLLYGRGSSKRANE